MFINKYLKFYKTIKVIGRTYYFLYIKKLVNEYMRLYDIYYKTKSAKYKFYEKLKFFIILNRF